MTPAITLIGPGRVGCAVARKLFLSGYRIAAVIGRDLTATQEAASFIGCDPGCATTELLHASRGEIILLAVADDQIETLARQLQQSDDLVEGLTLVHFSGLKPASCMAAGQMNIRMASLHPLLPFASRESAISKLQGCPCAVEGDQSALPQVEELVRAIGGTPFQIRDTDKALYHAAACITSNYLVTLTATARDLLTTCGFEQQQALELLRPLLKATSDNLLHLSPENALTGPIVRGDTGTVTRHLEALGTDSPEMTRLYRELGKATVKLALNSSRLPALPATQLAQLFDRNDTDTDTPH